MKVELHDRFAVTVTAETKVERLDLASVARIRPEDDAYLPLLTGEVTQVKLPAHHSATDGGGGWIRVTTCDTRFIAPYLERLQAQFGFTPVDIDFAPFLDKGRRIGHTELVETMRLIAETKTLERVTVTTVYPYQGETFASEATFLTRAAAEGLKDLADELGQTTTPPEFIPAGNGLYMHNPDYGRNRITYTPKVANAKLWTWLCHWWHANQATPGQRELLDRATEYWCEVSNDTLHYDNYEKQMTWEDFKKL